MAVYLPQNSGLWSTTTWITAFSNLTAFAGGNTPPTVIDDVYADGKTIYIDISTQVRTLLTSTTPRTGGLTGGRFIINNAVSLSASLSAGTTNCLTFLSAAPSFSSLIGNCSGSLTTANIVAATNSSSGTLTVYGNAIGGSLGGAHGLANTSSGVSILYGNARGGNGGNTTNGVNNTSTGSVIIYGNVTGFTAPRSYGANNSSTGSMIIYGNVTGGNNADNAWGASNFSSGILTIYGNVSGGTANQGAYNNSTGTIYISGNLYGTVAAGHGTQNASTGTIFVTGNIFGGTGTSITGLNNTSTGAVNVLGNIFGGTGQTAYGVQNNANGAAFITGNVTGGTGSTAYGGVNNATGYMEVNGIAIGNGWGLGSSGIGGAAPGIFGSQTGTTIIRGLSCGARGQWPTAGNVFIIPQNTSTATLFTSASAAQVLFTSLSTNIVPPASSVRLGTKYNLNDYTGTCIIPSVSSVLQGVAVDNSIGIAALQPQTIWNYSVLSATDVDSLGGRLKEVATVQSVGQQLTALN